MLNSLNVSENDTKNLTVISRQNVLEKDFTVAENQFFNNLEFYTDDFFDREDVKRIMNLEPHLSKKEIDSLLKTGIIIKEINEAQFIDVNSVLNIIKVLFIQNLEIADLRFENKIMSNVLERRKDPNFLKGICYIGIDSNWNGYYKIGKTTDLSCKSRISKASNPNYKILYKTDVTNDCGKLEHEIHEYLSQNHVTTMSGCKEWFSLTDIELNQLLEKFNFIKIGE